LTVIYCTRQWTPFTCTCLTVIYCKRQWATFTCTYLTALLYKTMDAFHLHMFDCAFIALLVLYCTRQFNWCMAIVFPPCNVNLEM
jgi:hypothetical protein